VQVSPTCEGAGASFLGLTLIKGMRRNGNSYDNGTITDPRDGSLYSALMRLSPDGQKLEVRGYLAISLFARSQIWNRLPDDVAYRAFAAARADATSSRAMSKHLSKTGTSRRRPPLAKIRPGSPAPTTGPGTPSIPSTASDRASTAKGTSPNPGKSSRLCYSPGGLKIPRERKLSPTRQSTCSVGVSNRSPSNSPLPLALYRSPLVRHA
jgi:hypothetical protein